MHEKAQLNSVPRIAGKSKASFGGTSPSFDHVIRQSKVFAECKRQKSVERSLCWCLWGSTIGPGIALKGLELLREYIDMA